MSAATPAAADNVRFIQSSIRTGKKGGNPVLIYYPGPELVGGDSEGDLGPGADGAIFYLSGIDGADYVYSFQDDEHGSPARQDNDIYEFVYGIHWLEFSGGSSALLSG